MTPINRRDLGSLAAGLATVGIAQSATAKTRSEISHTNAAIHQEIVFKATAARVYQTLTTAEAFDKVVQLSGAMNTSMKMSLGKAPTAIDAQPGGAFSFFGGYVTGRNVELVPDARMSRPGAPEAGTKAFIRSPISFLKSAERRRDWSSIMRAFRTRRPRTWRKAARKLLAAAREGPRRLNGAAHLSAGKRRR